MPGQLTRHSLLSNYLDMREVLYATRDSFTVYSTVHVTAVTSHLIRMAKNTDAPNVTLSLVVVRC